MHLLEKRILSDGKIFPGNILKVDSFLNHQIDPILLQEMGIELANHFHKYAINKVLTIETSGIALALTTALALNVPMVFAKKEKGLNSSNNVFKTNVFSYTKKKETTITVDKCFLNAQDKILIIDDFLANGQALSGLISLCKQAQATVIGAGIGIEKVFQGGGNKLRLEGYHIYSLAKISHFQENKILFEE